MNTLPHNNCYPLILTIKYYKLFSISSYSNIPMPHALQINCNFGLLPKVLRPPGFGFGGSWNTPGRRIQNDIVWDYSFTIITPDTNLFWFAPLDDEVVTTAAPEFEIPVEVVPVAALVPYFLRYRYFCTYASMKALIFCGFISPERLLQIYKKKRLYYDKHGRSPSFVYIPWKPIYAWSPCSHLW